MFAEDAHLAGATAVVHLAGAAVGRGLGDLLVGGVPEVIALVLDLPKPVASCDGQNRPIWNHSHR